MKRRLWRPIDDHGAVDQDELTLPDRTAEPTLYELHFNGDKVQLAAVYARAMVRRHTFRIVTPSMAQMEPTDMFGNVRVAVGPFRQPHVAEPVIASLLHFPAKYREVILVPHVDTYMFDLFRVCSTGRDTDRDHIRYTDALNGYTYDGSYAKDDPDAYTRHGRLDGVLVRGETQLLNEENVRLLHIQVNRTIGVERFSLDWGTYIPSIVLPREGSVRAEHLRGMLDGVWFGEER